MRLTQLVLVLVYLCIQFAGCAAAVPADPAIEQQLEQQIKQLLADAVAGLRRSDLVQARAALDLAAELRPDDPRVLDGYGCVYLRSGDASRAVLMFRRAIQADRGYSRPFAHLAAVAEQRGDYKSASELLAAALTLNPLNTRARLHYSNILRRKSPAAAYRELLKYYTLAER